MNAVYYRATLLCQALFIQGACMLLLLVCSVRLHIVNTESTGHFFFCRGTLLARRLRFGNNKKDVSVRPERTVALPTRRPNFYKIAHNLWHESNQIRICCLGATPPPTPALSKFLTFKTTRTTGWKVLNKGDTEK